jgi:hypothetical protein
MKVVRYLLILGTVGALSLTALQARGRPGKPKDEGLPLDAVTRVSTTTGSLRPAPAGLQPVISAEEAQEVAWGDRPEGTPTSASAAFGMYDAPYFDPPPGGIPVWVITYEGGCIRPAGPSPPPGSDGETPECVAVTWQVVVNATTGEFMLASN